MDADLHRTGDEESSELGSRRMHRFSIGLEGLEAKIPEKKETKKNTTTKITTKGQK